MNAADYRIGQKSAECSASRGERTSHLHQEAFRNDPTRYALPAWLFRTPRLVTCRGDSGRDVASRPDRHGPDRYGGPRSLRQRLQRDECRCQEVHPVRPARGHVASTGQCAAAHPEEGRPLGQDFRHQQGQDLHQEAAQGLPGWEGDDSRGLHQG